MRRFEMGSESGFRLRFAGADEAARTYDAASDDIDSFGDRTSKTAKSSESMAVAKALGIAIGLVVLYVMLRQYGGGVA
jgi:hypothetical protein